MTKEEAIQSILQKVTGRLAVQEENIFDKSKDRHHIDARHMFYYICKQKNINIHYIQSFADQYFNTKPDHSTIIYAQNKMENKVKKDKHWKDLHKQIINNK